MGNMGNIMWNITMVMVMMIMMMVMVMVMVMMMMMMMLVQSAIVLFQLKKCTERHTETVC